MRMINFQVKRGDVFYADLSHVVGNEVGNIRPVLIIQNDIGNRYAPTVIVAPISSQINKVRLPTQVKLNGQNSGLVKDSIAMLECVITIDKRRLIEKVGYVNNSTMEEVSNAWMIIGGIIPKSDINTETIEEFINYYKIDRFKLNEKFNAYEDYQCEFKELKGNNFKNLLNSTVAEYSAAFLNSKGGSIYYGITNDGIIKGVKLDDKGIDETNKLIYNNLANINPAISPNYFNIEYHPIYNQENKKIKDLFVVELVVPVSPNKDNIYFIKGTELHIRVKGVKKKLIGTEIVSYIQKKLLDEEYV